MASTRKRTTKDGQIFCEIRVSRGRRKSYLTYPPEGWGQKAIERALAKEASEFECRCHEVEVVSRAEQGDLKMPDITPANISALLLSM